jgi:sec-independent protein translocase protein TatB
MIGGLSMTELIIILGLALLLLGPDQLPQLAKSLGKGLREIRKATDDLKGQFEEEIARIDTDAAPRMIAPVPPPPDDPAAARAQARIAASNPPAPPPVVDAGAEVGDPAAARAAARRSAVKLVPPEGAVPREEPASPATGGAHSAQPVIEQK